ncbi:PorP/SprF family type IX secretion system membrane protein [Flavobacterium ammonificans]
MPIKMQKIKSKFLFLFIAFCFMRLSAQADFKLSNFSLTPLAYNPAYAGSNGGISLTSVYSSQWIGFPGAPKTILFNGHQAISDGLMGLGINAELDKRGAEEETKLVANFAYHLGLDDFWRFSMGIKAGIQNYQVDYSLLSIENPSEFIAGIGQQKTFNYIFGTGFYLHNENFFIGAAIPNLLAPSLLDTNNSTISQQALNYYFSSGYKIYSHKDFYIQPTVLTRLVKGAPVSTLIALNLNMKDEIYASANFEFKSSIGVFAGIRLYEKYLIGYAFDKSITKFNSQNNGTHSLFLNFNIDGRNNRPCSCYSY